ncbi:MAG: hypothetical protein ABFC31_08855 [Clostridiaceae bacterium]
MKKFLSSRFAKRLPVALGLFALCALSAVLLRSYWGSPEVWQRFINLVAVFGSGIAGVLFLLAGWIGILMGYGFVLTITLPIALPEPWSGYFVVLELLCVFALPVAMKYLKKGKKKPDTAVVSPAAKAQRPKKDAHISASKRAENAPILVQRPVAGGAYQVFFRDGAFLFYRVGSSWASMDPGKILLSGDPPPLGRRDFSIPAKDIVKIRFRKVEEDISPFDMFAKVCTRGRRYGFSTLLNPGGKALKALLREHAPQDALPQEALLPNARKKEFTPSPHKQKQTVLQRVYLGFCAFSLLTDLAWLFLDVPYRLFCWFALAQVPAFLLLYYLFPNEVTLTEYKKQANGRVMIAFSLLITAFVPLLRLMIDFNIRAWGTLLLIAGVTALLLVAQTLYLSPECRAYKRLLLTVGLAVAVWSVGAVGFTNFLFDGKPPAEQPAVVQEMQITHSSKSPDRYLITAETEDGQAFELSIAEELYDQLAVGSEVTVYLYQGAYNIPYAEADAP